MTTVPHIAGCLLLASVASVAAQEGATPTTSASPATPAWSRSRAIWFTQGINPVSAEICVGAEVAPLDGTAKQAFDSAAPGQRLPLGMAGWATLDSFTAFTCGDVKVKKGCYYLALERTKDGWALALLEPARIQKAQMLPGGAAGEKPVARLPVRHEDAADAALGFELAAEAAQGGATLKLRWGTHLWTAVFAVQGAAGAQPIVQAGKRGCSRTAFGEAKDDRQAFLLLDHGQPAWNDQRKTEAQQLPKGGRWRLGENWWTTLDANCPLTIGGKKLAPGSWHLSLKKMADDAWSLVCTAAADDTGGQIDAFAVDFSKASVEVPLTAGKAKEPAGTLQIACVADAGSHRLRIAFGERELSVPVAAR